MDRENRGERVCRWLFSLALGICFLWYLFLAAYMALGDKREVDHRFVLSLSLDGGLNVLINGIAVVLGVGLAAALLRRALGRLGAPRGVQTAVFYGLALAYIGYMALRTPLAPYHDAGDIRGIVFRMLAGELSGYPATYINFYVTNKLTALLYYPMARLLGNVNLSVQVTNALLLFGSAGLLSLGCGRAFGKQARELAVLLVAVLGPYMLLTGPYIYLPSLFFASAALFLYMGKRVGEKIGAFAVCGMLYALRPLALAPLLVLFAFDLVHGLLVRRTYRQTVLTAVALVICVLGVKGAVGGVLYMSGAHPYPGLYSSAGLWAVDVGTRLDEDPRCVGLTTYMPYGQGKSRGDEVAEGFHELWRLYGENTGDNYEEALDKQAEIKGLLRQRIWADILNSSQNTATFLHHKTYNFLADTYLPYYYMPRVQSDNASEEIYLNYQEKYFLHQNVLFFALGVSALYLTVSFLRKKGQWSGREVQVMGMLTGCMAMCMAVILLTEVMKKYVFDLYVPLLYCVVYGTVPLQGCLERIKRPAGLPMMAVGATACLMLSLYSYHRGNLTPLKGAVYHVEGDTLHIELDARQEEGWWIRGAGGQAYPLDEDSVEIPLEEGTNTAFYINTPTGQSWRILLAVAEDDI